MSQLVPQNFGPVSSRFQQVQPVDDLSAGVQSSFGLIGYKGKVWSIRYRGDEKQLLRDDGDGPRGSIEVVILKASSQISKIFYEHGYVEGSNAAPDCFSNNGIAPEPTSAKRQADSCALCPHNQWGSRITPAGKQGKACADSKRLAVVPSGDIANEAFGGPMLLRVPAASLQDVAHYGQKMQQMGYPYFSVATRISFDPAESYPKFLFNAIKPLSDQEAELVLTMRDGNLVQRILSESEFAAGPIPAADPASVFEQPPAGAQINPVQPTNAGTQANPQTGTGTTQTSEAPAQAPAQAPSVPANNGFGATAPVEKPAQTVEPVKPVEEPKADETVQQADQPAQPTMEQLMAQIEALKASQQGNHQGNQQPAQAAAEAPKVDEPKAEAPVTTAGNGFGATASVEKPAQQEAAPQPEQPAAEGSFEANLDDMLSNLLPSTN